MDMKRDKNIIWFSVPIIIFSLISCCLGIFQSNTIYARENLSYKTQAIGQDLVTLIIVLPVFVISMYAAYKKNALGILYWAGCLFYYLYTYLIYSFGLHFNRLILIYCVLLGLSVYGFMYFLFYYTRKIKIGTINIKYTAVYLFIIAGIFYMLWLSEEIPSIINNTIPKSVKEADIMINPVHIVDISLCLPFLILTGVLIQKKKQIGYMFAIVAMFFSILLSLAIIGMILVMYYNGVQTGTLLPILFIFVFIVSFLLLLITTIKIKKDIVLLE
jgi:hypothetical protein